MALTSHYCRLLLYSYCNHMTRVCKGKKAGTYVFVYTKETIHFHIEICFFLTLIFNIITGAEQGFEAQVNDSSSDQEFPSKLPSQREAGSTGQLFFDMQVQMQHADFITIKYFSALICGDICMYHIFWTMRRT